MSDAREELGHTKGPWHAGRPDMATVVDGFQSKWIYAGEQYVAVASGRIDGPWDEVMANAYLIAAAPSLLSAVAAFLRTLSPGREGRDYDGREKAIAAMRAAHAEATGRGEG